MNQNIHQNPNINRLSFEWNKPIKQPFGGELARMDRAASIEARNILTQLLLHLKSVGFKSSYSLGSVVTVEAKFLNPFKVQYLYWYLGEDRESGK
jgi:hypothetical protein